MGLCHHCHYKNECKGINCEGILTTSFIMGYSVFNIDNIKIISTMYVILYFYL